LSTVIAIGVLVLAQAAPGSAQPVARHPGAWSVTGNPYETFIPVHIALLPSHDPGSYHSRILWWNDSHGGEDEFGGKAWNWTPAVQNDCSTYPGANFLDVPLEAPDPRIFCSGFAPLRGPGSGLFISGGTEGVEFGAHNNLIYDTATNGWRSGGFMQGYRWYPTVTTLSDGRAMVLSGSKYFHTAVFGGKDSPAGAPHDELNRFVGNLRGLWDAPIPRTGTWPEARSYHAAATVPGKMLIIGGELANGAATDDVWELSTYEWNLTSTDPNYVWALRPLAPTSDRPGGRRRFASAATYGDTVWVIGGLWWNEETEEDEVKGDVWRLTKNAVGQAVWTGITNLGPDGPGPRFGHTAIFDRARNRILVFGGASSTTGAAVDDEIYALDLKAGTLQWAKLTPRSAVRPPARLGHALLYDRWVRPRDWYDPPGVDPPYRRFEHRAIVFGGESQLGSGLRNDVWHLWINDPGSIEWVPLTSFTNPEAAPSPRAWMGSCLDDTEQRLIIHGGATGPGSVADGQVHTLDVESVWPGYDTSS
jgi:hypothetical protein